MVNSKLNKVYKLNLFLFYFLRLAALFHLQILLPLCRELLEGLPEAPEGWHGGLQGSTVEPHLVAEP